MFDFFAKKAKKKIKKKIKKILIAIGIPIFFLFIIIGALSGTFSFSFSLGQIGAEDADFNKYFQILNGTIENDTGKTEEDIIIEILEKRGTVTKDDGTEVEDYIYDDALLGNTYFTREDFIELLKKVKKAKEYKSQTLDYEVKVNYYEWVIVEPAVVGVWDEVKQEYIGAKDAVYGWSSEMKTKYEKRSITVSSEAVEKSYKPNWREVYTMYTISSLSDINTWKDDSYDSVNNIYSIDEKGRLDQSKLQKIIDMFIFDFEYIYDAARTTDTNISWNEFDDIGYTQSADEPYQIDGKEKGVKYEKIPATALAYISNAYYYYSTYSNGNKIASYVEEFDAKKFVATALSINDQFLFDWYIDALRGLPNSGEYVAKYQRYYDSFLKGEEFVTVNSGQDDPSTITYGVIAGGNLTDSDGDIDYPKDPDYEFDSSGVGKDLTIVMKDNLTQSEMEALIRWWCTTAHPFPKSMWLSDVSGVAKAFLDAQEKNGVSALAMLALASHESGFGTSAIARAKFNFFGWGAYDASPAESAWSFSEGMYAGITQVIGYIANNYPYGRWHQDTFWKMRNNEGVHQYCTDSWSVWGVRIVGFREELMLHCIEMGYDVGKNYVELLSSEKGIEIATVAQKYIGGPYLYRGKKLGVAGSMGSDVGVDVGSFIYCVFEESGVSGLDVSLSRQYMLGKRVSVSNGDSSNLQLGDVVFYGSDRTIYAAAIYIGDGKVVYASKVKGKIVVSEYNYMNIIGARRYT